MLARLSLRLRILLFFALIVGGGIAIIGAALFTGYRSALSDGMTNGFVIAGLVAGFGFLGLVVAIWLLFDENVAKPIEAMATTLRAHAHSGDGAEVNQHAARYLGDLAPAAESLSTTLESARSEVTQKIASETEAMAQELDQLRDLVNDLPYGVLLLGRDDRISLYNDAAATALNKIAPPRLNAPLSDYVTAQPPEAAGNGPELALTSADGRVQLRARRAKSESSGATLLCLEPMSARPAPVKSVVLTYDFDLLWQAPSVPLKQRALKDIPFVVFDCETTGLLPHKDELVQVGALRLFRNQIIAGEEINRLIDPGRPIPAASTRIHHITDAMVADAPPPQEVVAEFHHFAREAVIVAHNAPFDMAFMRRHGNAMGLTWDQPILDTVLLSAMLYGTTEQHTLDALCARLGVVIPPHLRHTALGDARATAQVFCKMLPMLNARGYRTLEDILKDTQKYGRLLDDLN